MSLQLAQLAQETVQQTLDTSVLAQPAVRWTLNGLYLAVLTVVSIYGMHRYWLVWMYWRTRNQPTPTPTPFEQLPRVTVQLPMFNEPRVAARIIDAACQLDYPPELLQIQIVDDSTDETQTIAKARVQHWIEQWKKQAGEKQHGQEQDGAERGGQVATASPDIQYLHRVNREGFKAGALAAAMPVATGEFVAIFDADFIPEPDFLMQVVHHFTDDKVGMVQARWEHINRDDSLLTRAQAIYLDGHFVIEHTARHRNGRWFNFNGTAGIWRKQTIEDAGGWEHETLTEDVDLSYRAQLAGWRFVYLPDVTCPAELPPEINAFKAQQHRWAKGSIQCAQKLLPRVMQSDAPASTKYEVFMHLTGPIVYPCITVMALLFYPALYINFHAFVGGATAVMFFGLSVFTLGTLSAACYFVSSQTARGCGWLRSTANVPLLMCIGIGVALNSARGVMGALLGMKSPFERTPKYNTTEARTTTATTGVTSGPADDSPLHATEEQAAPTDDQFADSDRQIMNSQPHASPPRARLKIGLILIELALGAYVLFCAWLSLTLNGRYFSVPFLLLFAVGYSYVGITSLTSHQQWNHKKSDLAPQLTT